MRHPKKTPRRRRILVHRHRFVGLDRGLAAVREAIEQLNRAAAHINGALGVADQTSRLRHTALRDRLIAVEQSVRRLEWPVDPPRVAVRGDFINDEVDDDYIIGSGPGGYRAGAEGGGGPKHAAGPGAGERPSLTGSEDHEFRLGSSPVRSDLGSCD